MSFSQAKPVPPQDFYGAGRDVRVGFRAIGLGHPGREGSFLRGAIVLGSSGPI
jgi:hypothetical protein